MTAPTAVRVQAATYASQRTSTLPSYFFIVLLVVVVLSPLPFGSVTAWAWGPLSIVTSVLLSVWAILVATGRITIGFPFARIWIPALLFGLTVLWIAIQITPVTPRSWHHPIWAEASAALGLPYSGRITLDPSQSRAGMVRLLWYGMVFWLALQTCRKSSVARTAITFMAWSGVAYATYGLIIHFSGSETVLWLSKTSYQGDVTGTFINKNSFAAFAGFGWICVSGLLVDRLLGTHIAENTWKQRVVEAAVYLLERNWHLLLGWAVLLAAIILSNSRAGLVCSIAGVLTLGLVLSLSRVVSSRGARWFSAVAAVVCFLLFAVLGESIDRRFTSVGEATKPRLEVYKVTIDAIEDAPIVGMGFGTYAQIFQLYRSTHWQLRVAARKAHNTYLENAAELGIPAATALTLSVLSLFVICVLGTRRRRRDVVLPAIGVSVSVLLGLHSFVDFSLQIPGIAVSYAFLMGLASAQSFSSRSHGSGSDQ